VANGTIYVSCNTHLYAFYDAARSAAGKDEAPRVNLNPAKPDSEK
jgi:hypothetical protein